MKKLGVTLIAAGLLAASAGTAGGAQQVTRPKPVVTVLFTPAVVVVGKRFKARERVKVTLLAETPYVRTVRATTVGTFRVSFGTIPVNDCTEFTLKAVGTLGSRFSMYHPAKPC